MTKQFKPFGIKYTPSNDFGVQEGASRTQVYGGRTFVLVKNKKRISRSLYIAKYLGGKTTKKDKEGSYPFIEWSFFGPERNLSLFKEEFRELWGLRKKTLDFEVGMPLLKKSILDWFVEAVEPLSGLQDWNPYDLKAILPKLATKELNPGTRLSYKRLRRLLDAMIRMNLGFYCAEE